MARRVEDPRGGEWVVKRRWIDQPRTPYGLNLFRSEDAHAGLRTYGYAPSQVAAGMFFYPLMLLTMIRRGIEFFTSFFAHARGAPWTIEARLDAVRQERLSWRVPGWSESKRAVDEVAHALSQGHELTSFGEPDRL